MQKTSLIKQKRINLETWQIITCRSALRSELRIFIRGERKCHKMGSADR